MRAFSRRVLALYARAHSVPAHEVQVNMLAPEGLGFLLVRDGKRGQIDARGCPLPEPAGTPPGGTLDAWSVDEVCSAERHVIRCSANAVASLRTDAGPLDSSPALLFLVAHELAHVALGHPGHFGERLQMLDLTLDPREKVGILAKLCGEDPVTMAQERAADELAQSALAELLVEPPFLEPVAGRGGSLALSATRMRHETEALERWGRQRIGAPAGTKISLGESTLCTLLRSQTGGAVLPTLGGTHPRGERRLADLSARLRGAAARLDNKPLVDPSHPGSKMGNFTDLVRSMGDIQATMDKDDALATDGASNAFCNQVYAADSALPPCR